MREYQGYVFLHFLKSCFLAQPDWSFQYKKVPPPTEYIYSLSLPHAESHEKFFHKELNKGCQHLLQIEENIQKGLNKLIGEVCFFLSHFKC